MSIKVKSVKKKKQHDFVHHECFWFNMVYITFVYITFLVGGKMK